MEDKYIGQKKIKRADLTTEKTPSGLEITEVEFEDGVVERFSAPMLKAIVTDKAISLDELREKRIQPVASVVLTIMRDWGIKLSELAFFSVLLQNSLDYNRDQALNKLWGKYMPKPQAPDEVDLLTIDKVLRDV